MQNGAQIGPVISPESKARIEKLIQSAKDQGAKILLDGRGVKVPGFEKGNFIGPTGELALCRPNLTSSQPSYCRREAAHGHLQARSLRPRADLVFASVSSSVSVLILWQHERRQLGRCYQAG
jgi:hypothetical protein